MMHDTVWNSVSPTLATPPSNHWQRPRFHDGEQAAARPGHTFGPVPVNRTLTPRIQPKLTVSAPRDGAELEADAVADAVMSMPESPGMVARADELHDGGADTVQRKCTECDKDSAKPDQETTESSSKKEVQRMAEDEEAQRAAEEEDVQRAAEEEDVQRAAEEEDVQRSAEEEDVQRAAEEEEAQRSAEEEEAQRSAEEEDVQRSADDEEAQRAAEDEEAQRAAKRKSRDGDPPNVTPAVESEVQSVRSGGAPLPKETREFFEPRFGTSFADVRVHTGNQAAGVARKLNAKAFTMGTDITFGEGHYQPGSSDGKRLLAHELTHVVQQRGGR